MSYIFRSLYCYLISFECIWIFLSSFLDSHLISHLVFSSKSGFFLSISVLFVLSSHVFFKFLWCIV